MTVRNNSIPWAFMLFLLCVSFNAMPIFGNDDPPYVPLCQLEKFDAKGIKGSGQIYTRGFVVDRLVCPECPKNFECAYCPNPADDYVILEDDTCRFKLFCQSHKFDNAEYFIFLQKNTNAGTPWYRVADLKKTEKISLSELEKLAAEGKNSKTKGYDSVNVRGVVVDTFVCPPCPKGAKCDKCPSEDYIVLKDEACSVKIPCYANYFDLNAEYVLYLEKHNGKYSVIDQKQVKAK